MALPVWLTAGTTSVLKAVGASAGGAAAGAGQQKMSTITGMAGNVALPLAMPGIETLISTYERGHLGSYDTLRSMLRLYHGVSLPEDLRVSVEARQGSSIALKDAWAATVLSSREVPQPKDLSDVAIAGVLPRADMDSFLSRSGADEDSWRRFWDLAKMGLSPGATIDAVNRGLLRDDQAREWLARSGVHQKRAQDVLLGGPGTNVLIEAGEIPLRYQLPTMSDLVHFAVKDAMSPAVADRLKLYHEYPTLIDPWAARQGALYPLPFQVEVEGGRKVDATWPMVHWAAHWTPVAPGQAYEMLHRVRPDRVERLNRALGLGQDVEQLRPFTLQDLRIALRVQDYPPWARDYLAAIAYSVPRLVDIRNAYVEGIIDRRELVAQFLDRGAHPDDAEVSARLADSMLAKRAAAELKRQQALNPKTKLLAREVQQAVKNVRTAYRAGWVTQTRAAELLMNLLQADAEIVASILGGIDLEVDLALSRAAVDALRRSYLSGEIDAGQIQDTLVEMGMAPARAAQLASRWRFLLSGRKVYLSAQRVEQMVARGTIDVAEGARRLRNLGYVDPDRVLILAEATASLAERRRKERAANEEVLRRRAKVLEEQLGAGERLLIKQRAALKSLTPPATLIRWATAQVISQAAFVRRMGLLGYPLPEIAVYWTEIQRKIAEKAKKEKGDDDEPGQSEASADATNGAGVEESAAGPVSADAPERGVRTLR